MVARAKTKSSVNISGYLDEAIDKLIEKEPFRTKTNIVNEALDMYLKSKGYLGKESDEAVK